MLFGMVIVTSLVVSLLAAVVVDTAYQACTRIAEADAELAPRVDVKALYDFLESA